MNSLAFETIGFWVILALILFIYLLKVLKADNKITDPKTITLPKVLYIRSFNEDPEDDYQEHFEDTLYSSFKKIAVVIAIGKPNRHEKRKRIFKYYFEEDKWKEEAVSLMRESYLIILKPNLVKANIGSNLLWEFEQILDMGYLNKLIIISKVGNIRDKKIDQIRYNNYKKFCEEKNPKFKTILPDYKDTSNYIYYKQNVPEHAVGLLNIPKYLIKYFRYIISFEKRKSRRLINFSTLALIGFVIGFILTNSLLFAVVLATFLGFLSYQIPTNTIGCKRKKAAFRKRSTAAKKSICT